jgi:DNA-binding response OmpR family regulator
MAEPEPRPLRILIVDDAAGALLIVGELTRAGFEPTVSRVETLQSFQEAFARQTWDLIVADYALPSISALGVLDFLGRREIDVPVIVVSARVAEEELVGVMKAGAQDCLLKDNLRRLGPAVVREVREAAVRRAAATPGQRACRRRTVTACSWKRSQPSPSWPGPTTSAASCTSARSSRP